MELQVEVEDLRNHHDRASKAYKTARHSEGHLEQELKRKNHEIRELQQEIVEYKSIVSSSTLLDKQMSDTAIQDKMNALSFALRDWAVGVVRQGNIGELRLVYQEESSWHEHLTTDFRDVLVIDIVRPEDSFLADLVPQFQEATFTQKVNALIATFSTLLVNSFKKALVFGTGSHESYRSARLFHKSFNGMTVDRDNKLRS